MSYSQHAAVKAIEYPESDGKPMAETDIHIDTIIDLREALVEHFSDDPQVYVSGNLLIYYVEGNPKQRVAPDVFFVRGVPKHRRRVYFLWEEGVAPSVVFEISSRGTYLEDLQKKWQLYAQLGISEYYLYDPEYDYLKESFIAYRLKDGVLEEVPVPDGMIHSPALGLDLVDTGQSLRLRNPQTGLFLPTPAERHVMLGQAEVARLQAEERAQAESAARLQAEERVQAESAARLQAEAETARLREELKQLRTQS